MNIDDSQFSEREKDTLKLLLQGKSNKQIALELGIANRTVEFHLGNIYAKLGVSSRTEAVLKLSESDLWKSTGDTGKGYQGKSTVDAGSENTDNGGKFMLQRQETGDFLVRHKLPIFIGSLLVIVFVFILFAKATWSYEREGEYPDDSTVGQTIERSNASGSKVHGQFGTVPAWPAKSGYVNYKNISIPRSDRLYLKLRYSKYSSSSVPILVFIDNESTPRATIYPRDQGDWNNFVWTEPIHLGSIENGVRSITFYTGGQEFGVADLDKFILTINPP